MTCTPPLNTPLWYSPTKLTVGSSNHTVAFFTSNRKTIIRDFQLRCCVEIKTYYSELIVSFPTMNGKLKVGVGPLPLFLKIHNHSYLCREMQDRLCDAKQPYKVHQELACLPMTPDRSLTLVHWCLLLPKCTCNRP